MREIRQEHSQCTASYISRRIMGLVDAATFPWRCLLSPYLASSVIGPSTEKCGVGSNHLRCIGVVRRKHTTTVRWKHTTTGAEEIVCNGLLQPLPKMVPIHMREVLSFLYCWENTCPAACVLVLCAGTIFAVLSPNDTYGCHFPYRQEGDIDDGGSCWPRGADSATSIFIGRGTNQQYMVLVHAASTKKCAW